MKKIKQYKRRSKRLRRGKGLLHNNILKLYKLKTRVKNLYKKRHKQKFKT